MAAFMWLITALAIGFAQMPIDPQHLADTVASDEAVIRQLRAHGDVAHIVRPIELYFYGPPVAIARLEGDLPDIGWKFVSRIPPEDGESGLVVSREQTTDEEAIRHLSEAALRVELDYGVKYDGWESIVENR
jgi:regulator of ribonuclease activity B